MFVCMLGFLLVRNRTIYEKQLPARLSSPAHQRRIIRTLLERSTVQDILALRPSPPPQPVSERTPLAAVLERFSSSGLTCLPVLGEDGALVGVVSFEAVRYTLSSRAALSALVVARDLATPQSQSPAIRACIPPLPRWPGLKARICWWSRPRI